MMVGGEVAAGSDNPVMSYMCVRAYADCGMAGGRRTSPVGRLLPPMGGRLPPTPAAAVTAAVNSRLTNRLVNHRLHTGAYRSSLARLRSLFNVVLHFQTQSHTHRSVYVLLFL